MLTPGKCQKIFYLLLQIHFFTSSQLKMQNQAPPNLIEQGLNGFGKNVNKALQIQGPNNTVYISNNIYDPTVHRIRDVIRYEHILVDLNGIPLPHIRVDAMHALGQNDFHVQNNLHHDEVLEVSRRVALNALATIYILSHGMLLLFDC